VPAPLSAYGTGALAVARAAGHSIVQVLARKDPVAREAAQGFVAAATAAGMAAALVTVSGGTSDYGPQIAAIDAAEMVKSFKRLRYTPRLFLAQGAAEPDFVRRVGQDAEHALGLSPYEVADANPANAAFVAAWRGRWQGEPGAVAASTYAAAQVLGEAARVAGSLEQESLRKALATLELQTPLGRHRVGESGVQQGARPVVVQIHGGRRKVVWPPAQATAQWRLPYPRWDERQVDAAQ
jgi:ABC-type branched-subunit amino acid transport system substrate-binding protein